MSPSTVIYAESSCNIAGLNDGEMDLPPPERRVEDDADVQSPPAEPAAPPAVLLPPVGAPGIVPAQPGGDGRERPRRNGSVIRRVWA